MADMVSRDRDAPLDWPGMGTGKAAPALEKLGLDEGTPESVASPGSWSMEGPGKELSVNWAFSLLGFLAACVALQLRILFNRLGVFSRICRNS